MQKALRDFKCNHITMSTNPETPFYILHEAKLRRNLKTIKHVAQDAGVEIILAFKAFALWRTFGIFRDYIHSTTASSPFEARLAKEEFHSLCHTYSPAYEQSTFPTILQCSKSITFNSLSQYERFYPMIKSWNATANAHPITTGLRINPEHSEIATLIYNPCAPGTRFGITADKMPETLPEGVEGFHCHCHCENDSYALECTLKIIETKFGHWLDKLKWINLGGGHLMTRKDYDIHHLIKILKNFKNAHPNLSVILEPGSAFAWQTGELVSSVVDITEDKGIKTAVLNVSFTCHMPDCLEMPYQPDVENAESLGTDISDDSKKAPTVYRLGGNSCLSGDYMGYWKFPNPLSIGDTVVFLDMIHYTMVKTTMFNGIQHPAIYLRTENGKMKPLRKFTYTDYRDLMD